jgi:hypothetical protein
MTTETIAIYIWQPQTFDLEPLILFRVIVVVALKVVIVVLVWQKGKEQINYFLADFTKFAKTTIASTRIKITTPKKARGILKASSECKTVVEGVINIPPK